MWVMMVQHKTSDQYLNQAKYQQDPAEASEDIDI